MHMHIQLDIDDASLRKRWLSFSEEDEELIKEVDQLLEENLDPLIDDMYAHFLSFDETRKFFPDQATLERAQKAQRNYFRRLTKGNYDAAYIQERLAVGSTHYRIGLDPIWYLGAYNRIMTWLRQLVQEKYMSEPEKFFKVISALTRLIFFDMGLAIESYTIAKEQAIRQQSDAIKVLETQRRVTKAILEDAPVGIAQLDCQFKIYECNNEFAQMLGRKNSAQILGESLEKVAPGISLALFKELIDSGQPQNRIGEQLLLSPDAESGYFDWTAWPIKDESGNTRGLVSMFMEVSDRLNLQQQREDFVATLTHDLKTPILAANRAIKLLMEGDFGPVVEAQLKILATIHQSNESLYKMVQTLLDVYRYDSGAKNLSLDRNDLCSTILSIVDEIRALADSKKVTLDLQLPEQECMLTYDKEEIRRVLQNLLDNSLKFTAAGGKISVMLEELESCIRISVSDTGKGISEEDRPKLFQRFWQAASSGGRYHASTGLGLYLCRKIVELHGGRINCESSPGVGSRFFFTLPLLSDSETEDSD